MYKYNRIAYICIIWSMRLPFKYCYLFIIDFVGKAKIIMSNVGGDRWVA